MTALLTVTVKTIEDGTYKKKFMMHQPSAFDPTDPEVKICIEQTIAEVKGTPDDVKIRASMEC